MKYWPLALLFVCHASVGSYRVVFSPSLKLEVFIDDVADASPKNWCVDELAVRIVASGDKQPALLQDFLPKVGSLLANQCAVLDRINWRMEDSSGRPLTQGNALKTDNWALPQSGGALPPTIVGTPPAPADTTLWLQFSLPDGCHFRGYWGKEHHTTALFVATIPGATCSDDGWLSGQGIIDASQDGVTTRSQVTFLQGFPVLAANHRATDRVLHITTVNNQRMVLSDAESSLSWMILPYDARQNGWRSDGTVAVQLAQSAGHDENTLNAQLAAVRTVWAPRLATNSTFTVLLVDTLQPQLNDPAAGAWRTLHQEIK